MHYLVLEIGVSGHANVVSLVTVEVVVVVVIGNSLAHFQFL